MREIEEESFASEEETSEEGEFAAGVATEVNSGFEENAAGLSESFCKELWDLSIADRARRLKARKKWRILPTYNRMIVELSNSPDSVPVSPGEPDPLPQLKRPTGVADIREDSNVGPDSADPDNLQEAYVDFGNKEANASIRDFSIDDFDEEGLIAETPTLHFMYSSPQFDGQLPGDIFSEPTFDKNLEDDSFEGICLLPN
ncbi:uncharacterized protein LOC109827210 [Asparagus officinalis]|uniref:uncharacterized protein LOC109827210 n=1 Tax=Asparagus officinalis TaxID=4686 RepID=UPI00098E3807|nr:uncharacterized protein LOC109827210 [Asparagus officinalis]